jgi:glycosyltransferase involved in cell wall biosynthesis
VSARVTDNAAWASASPALSVLTPFLRDDPEVLLADLDREAAALAGRVEIVLLDDGTGDAALTDRLIARITGMTLPVRLITLAANEGRSQGRNRLSTAARGRSLLFLDSDMRPDTDRFLQDWAALVAREDPAVAFGGFTLKQAPADAKYQVHRAMAARSDCLPSQDRARQPEKYVFTSNLLVRRDVFEAEAFDPGFTGWGWEDVEWAMRVSQRFAVIHPDIPATHMGLDTVDSLARKYEQAAPNFARMARRHPAIVATYPGYRAARLLKRVPALPVWRQLLRKAAGTAWLPVAARAFSLRLYRTTLYADVV